MPIPLPLIVLDEVMLPSSDTELGLEPEELERLTRAGCDAGTPVVVACRVPGSARPTRLEQRASGPGELAPAVLVGEAELIPATPDDPNARLALRGCSRARLGALTADGEGWRAEVEGWPYDPAGVTAEAASELAVRFYRVLLATRPLESGDAAELVKSVDEPVGEIVEAGNSTQRLLLLADYLFEQPDVRFQVLTADTLEEVEAVVGDALELIEQGFPGGPGLAREPLRRYITARGLGDLARGATIVSALADVLQPTPARKERLVAAVAAVVGAQAELDAALAQLFKRSS